jgi:acyl-CoA thioesterase
MFEADVASRSLGIELVELAEGLAIVRMRVTAAMVNGHAIGHGGYVFLLADTAFACACNTHGPVTVAAGASITFLAPVAEGDLLTARAQERVLFGRSGIYDVTVHRGDEIVAEFRGHSRTLARQKLPGGTPPGRHVGPGSTTTTGGRNLTNNVKEYRFVKT